MAYPQADLTNIDIEIVELATNRRPVKFVIDGNVVQYSLIEMPQLRALRNEIAAELSATDPDSNATFIFKIYGQRSVLSLHQGGSWDSGLFWPDQSIPLKQLSRRSWDLNTLTQMASDISSDMPSSTCSVIGPGKYLSSASSTKD